MAQFKRGDFSTCVASRPGRPKTVTTPEIIDQIQELILEDRRISTKSIAEQLSISRERVGSIIHEDLNMRKLSAKWGPKLPERGSETSTVSVWTWTKKLLAYILRVDHRHPAGLDYPPRFSTLAPTETVSDPLDYGTPRSISLANTTTPLSSGLCGFYAPGQVEATPTRQQAPSYRQVSGCHRLAAILKRTFGQSISPSPVLVTFL